MAIPLLFIFHANCLETVYIESWAARKFVNIPVSDSAVRWRSFDNEEEGDDEIVGAMIAAEIKTQGSPANFQRSPAWTG